MFYIRSSLLFLWVVLVSIAMLFIIPFRWGDVNLDHVYSRMFGRIAEKLTGLRIQARGLENLDRSHPCIVVGNHQGMIDIATFGRIYPRKTILIAKKQLVWIPVFGVFFAGAGNVLIDRKNRRSSIGGLDQAVKKLREEGASIWIFPEGTRNRTEDPLLPFKKGAFHMAITAQVPVVPIVCEPIKNRVNWKKKLFTAGPVRLEVLEPVQTKGMTGKDVDRLSTLVRERMLKAFHGLSV